MELRKFLATTIALSFIPASAALADESWMRQCIEEQGGSTVGYAQCVSQYQQQLEDEQTEILGRIRKLFASQAPEGANYKAAARSFNQAQKHWLAYVKSDCAVIDESFGEGSARGLAGASCVSDHYAARNVLLKELEKGVDQTVRLDE